MARSLGPLLPDALLGRLGAPDPADRLGPVVVLATVDPYGWPHPALVSYAELFALDAGRLRLALRVGTRSATHLGEAGRATLIFTDSGVARYVKVDAVPLPPAPGAPSVARFELAVREVMEDRAEGEEAGARLTSGVSFAWPGGLDAFRRHAGQHRAILEA